MTQTPAALAQAIQEAYKRCIRKPPEISVYDVYEKLASMAMRDGSYARTFSPGGTLGNCTEALQALIESGQVPGLAIQRNDKGRAVVVSEPEQPALFGEATR